MIPERDLPFSDIQPFVRHVQRLFIQPGDYPVFTRSYDCRLFYVYQGEGVIFVDRKAHKVTHGDMTLWQPDIDYRMETGAEMQFLCVNFDYTLNHRALDYPIPPDRSDLFDASKATEKIRFTDVEPLNSPVLLRKAGVIENDLLEMKREYQARRIFWRERLSGLAVSMLSHVARRLSLSASVKAPDDARMDEVIDYIQTNFNRPLTNTLLGRHFNYHPNYLNRLLLMHTGQTLHQYLLTCRVSQAIELLVSTDLSITEIAGRTGLGTVSHFSKLFKRKTGNNPSDYRRNRRPGR